MSLHNEILAVMAYFEGPTTCEAIHDKLVERNAMPLGMSYGAVITSLRGLCQEKLVKRAGLLNDDPAFELVAKPDTKRQDPELGWVEISRFLGWPETVAEPEAFPGVNIDGPRAGPGPAPAADSIGRAVIADGYILVPLVNGRMLIVDEKTAVGVCLSADVVRAICRLRGGT